MGNALKMHSDSLCEIHRMSLCIHVFFVFSW